MNKRLLWACPTSNTEAARRAGGRRRYNAERQQAAKARLEAVLNLRWYQNLSQAEIARRLGVHRSTISRDLMPWRDGFFFRTGLPKRYYRYNYCVTYRAGRGWSVR